MKTINPTKLNPSTETIEPSEDDGILFIGVISQTLSVRNTRPMAYCKTHQEALEIP